MFQGPILYVQKNIFPEKKDKTRDSVESFFNDARTKERISRYIAVSEKSLTTRPYNYIQISTLSLTNWKVFSVTKWIRKTR